MQGTPTWLEMQLVEGCLWDGPGDLHLLVLMTLWIFPFGYGLDLVTCFHQTEYGKSDELSPLLLGYNKIMASPLPSLSFSLLASSEGSQLLLLTVPWIGPCVKGLMSLANMQWGPEFCPKPSRGACLRIPWWAFRWLHSGWHLGCGLWRNPEPKAPT